jgi:hypothetical protein
MSAPACLRAIGFVTACVAWGCAGREVPRWHVPPKAPRTGSDPVSPLLGTPCKPHENVAGTVDACGDEDRVSIEYVPASVASETPCKVQSLVRSGTADGSSRFACIAGDDLFVAIFCTMCRDGAAPILHANVPELSHDQARALFRQLDLHGSIPSSSSDWKDAIALAMTPVDSESR